MSLVVMKGMLVIKPSYYEAPHNGQRKFALHGARVSGPGRR